MQIIFNITEKQVNDMEASDYEAFERAMDGEFKLYRIRPAICRFMVDEKNNPIPYQQALKISEKMKLGQVKEFLEKFFETMRLSTVPKMSGTSSQLPLEAVMEASGSQPG